MELALRRTLQLGGTVPRPDGGFMITTAHVLLGVVDQPENAALRMLRAAHIDVADLRRRAQHVAAPDARPDAGDEDADEGEQVIWSIFGFPSHLSLEGPAARAVLALAHERGGGAAPDLDELVAAAESDAASRDKEPGE